MRASEHFASGWARRTWFWMRSLTRSIGAAAVFETAAETPPTVVMLLARSHVSNYIHALISSFRGASFIVLLTFFIVARKWKGVTYSRSRRRSRACPSVCVVSYSIVIGDRAEPPRKCARCCSASSMPSQRLSRHLATRALMAVVLTYEGLGRWTLDDMLAAAVFNA